MSEDPEIIPLPSRFVRNPFTGEVEGQQRFLVCPGTLDFMEAQFTDGP